MPRRRKEAEAGQEWRDRLVDEMYERMERGERPSLSHLLEGLLHRLMERERRRFLEMGKGEQANGFYQRKLYLTLGQLDLKVPRVRRGGAFRPAILPPCIFRQGTGIMTVSAAKGVAGRIPLGQQGPQGSAGRHAHQPVARTVARAHEPASTRQGIGQGGAMSEEAFVGIDVCKERLEVAIRPRGRASACPTARRGWRSCSGGSRGSRRPWCCFRPRGALGRL
ncbi:hypothetical protein HRbin24_00387 [bacterium HR24]|nr:hypothetical protein HRbin24_00387 [bacterium HR24]